MTTNKTQPTDASVDDFVAAAQPHRRRDEGEQILALMRDVTGEPGVMWGSSIVGFGDMHYRYASGREGDWMRAGFSPRKAQFTLYGLQDHEGSSALLPALGPHTLGVGCVYIKRIDAVELNVLRKLINLAFSRADYDAGRNS